MRLFLAVLEGRSPKDAVPVLASEDPHLIRMVAQALSSRLGGSDPGVSRILALAETLDPPGQDGGSHV